MAFVKNMRDTSDLDPNGACSSWQEFWEVHMHRKFSKCSRVGCQNPAEVGAHVKDAYRVGVKYITPLCKACNNYTNTDVFEVADSDLLQI